MRSYMRYNSETILCHGPEGHKLNSPVRLEIEIGELYCGKYTIFPNCSEETKDRTCNATNAKDISCRFRKVSKEKLKEEFFPKENVYGLPSDD